MQGEKKGRVAPPGCDALVEIRRKTGKLGLACLLVLAAACGTSREVGRGAAEGAVSGVKQESQHPDAGPPAFESATRDIMRGALSELDRPERRAEIARIFGAATQGALGSAAGTGVAPSNGTTGSSAPTNAGPAQANGQPGGSPNGQPGAANGPAPVGVGGGPTNGAAMPIQAGPVAALGGSFSTGLARGLSQELTAELGPDGQGPLAKTFTSLAQQMSGAAANGLTEGLVADNGSCGGADRGACAEQRVQNLSRSIGSGFAQGFATAIRLPLLILAFAAGIVATVLALAVLRFARRPAVR